MGHPTNGTNIVGMPRQNTSPVNFPAFIRTQIVQIAERIAATRKARGETQAQWAARLGISQPTMARIERGDPGVAAATYVMCLWLVNPELDLLQLLPSSRILDDAAQQLVPPDILANSDSPSVADEFAALLAQWQVPAL
ncbi:MAG: helix-turn-helix domain-containing protein [Comamonas sp.]